ncbi:MAG: ABC-2 transporter permease [Lachnospiraceae bacterium]|nr:ABC-2 transporter permease [Lachnospiraceae bacterium]
MKGLLLKDWYMTRKYCRSYLFMAAIFIAMSFLVDGNLFFVLYPCLLCGMIPVNLLAYDERSHWVQYSETLPYTKAQLVTSKYLIGLFTQCAMLLMSGAAYAVKVGRGGNFQVKEFMMLLLMLFMASAVAPSISLPFIFKLGVEKGRIGYLVMVGIICALAVLGIGIFNKENLSQDILSAETLPILPICCLVIIGLYILSWRLSIAFYEKREVS